VLATGVLGLGREIRAVNFSPVLDTGSHRDGGVALVVSRVDRLQARDLRASLAVDWGVRASRAICLAAAGEVVDVGV
jgi:hypothetical protein